MPDKNIIQYGATSDTPLPIIGDEVPEKSVRVYPYILNNTGNTNRKFIDNNSTSVVSFSRISDTNLMLDEDNNSYLQCMIEDPESQEFIDIPSGTMTKNVNNVNAISNESFDTSSGKLFIATIGSPLVVEDYENGDQDIFLMSNFEIIKTSYESEELKEFIINTDSMTTLSLIDIKLIVAQYTNAKLRFERDFSLTTEDITMDVDGEVKYGINLRMYAKSLLSYVSIKGLDNNGNVKNFDIETNKSMIPVMAIPTSVKNDKVISTVPWFNNTFTPSLFFAQSFRSAKTIPDFFEEALEDQVDQNYDAELTLIRDVLSYSVAFGNNFKDFERHTGSGDAGILKSEQKIGSDGVEVVSLEGRDPYTVVKTLIDTWKEENPGRLSLVQYKLMQNILYSLSKYTVGPWTVFGSKNDFIEFKDPWFLINSSPLTLVVEGGNYLVPSTITFTSTSLYFDKNLVDNSFVPRLSNINQSRTLSSDSDLITTPTIPENISEISISTSPDADVSPTNYLSYQYYIPSDSVEAFQNIYVGSLDSDSGDGFITIRDYTTVSKYTRREVADAQPARDAWLVQDVANVYNTDEINVNIIISGDEIKIGELELIVSAVPDDVRNNEADGDGFGATQSLTEEQTLDIAQRLGYISPEERSRNMWTVTDSMEIIWNTVLGGQRTNIIGVTNGILVADRFDIQNATVTITGEFDRVSYDDREIMMTKDRWDRLIIDNVAADGISTELLLPVYSEYGNMSSIYEVEIGSIWADTFELEIGNKVISIDTINKDQETVTVEKIIFT